MKSGGPWNLRGLRPETREAARNAARRSGTSVGEWLNSVIQQDDDDYGEPMRSADYDDRDDDRDDDVRRESRHDNRRGPPRRASRHENHEPPRRRHEREVEIEREPRRTSRRENHQDYEPPRPRREREVEIEREAALAREEFGEVHVRLDRLTQQLERMARTSAPRLTGAPVQQQPYPRQPPPRPRNDFRTPSNGPSISVDDAVAEIAERQRVLYGDDAVAPIAPMAPPPEPPPEPLQQPFIPSAQQAPEPAVDISNLEEQLRHITARIESLRPSGDLEKVITSFRQDLAEIREQLTEALPRRAVESLEIEVQALAQRLDHSRESGVDLGVLAGLERGLAEVRDALRSLTPAENLVGFDDAVKTLAQKVDLIAAKEDPAALQQLETAIGALRGIVSHVASNDTLTKVADEVRSLAAKVDGVANSAASGQAISALESRIDTLTDALNASTEAGHAVPRELEKLLSGLIEKLEWVQLTHTDHAALGALEDRIAQWIKRLDASDARLGNLEAVERGLADLLVHIDQIRGGDSVAAVAAGAMSKPVVVDAIEREVAEIKRSEQRTQDSLEAVHNAVEQVVDRLAMIESGMHAGAAGADATRDTRPALEPAPDRAAKPVPILPVPMFESLRAAAAAPPMPTAAAASPPLPATAEIAARRVSAPRPPIDPNLPPDHPLEPGSASGPRTMPSAAERIAASEAAADFAKPAVISEPVEKSNFIAAARRAAQAAAAPSERQARGDGRAIRAMLPERPSRLRKLLVAGGAVLVAVGFLHVALRMFQDRAVPNNSPAATPAAPSQQTAPPKVLPDADPSKADPRSGPLVLPVPGASSNTAPGTTPDTAADPAPGMSSGVMSSGVTSSGVSSSPMPVAPPTATPSGSSGAAPAAPSALPQRQSSLPNWADITGSLPRRVPPPQARPPASFASQQAPVASAPAMVADKLPATIGGPKLRAAATAGDAAAEFEVATRFAEGHGVTPSNEQAVRWFELAAKQGLAPAQFRLGAFYEKGIVVKKDFAVAREFYAAAAAKGNAKAMHNLAVLYAEGINGSADYRSAAQWFRKAADHGIADSQYNLAILYARGIGVEQNYAESYKWFALAASKGDSDAAKKRDEVASHLDAQSLAAAKLSVQKWSAEPQPQDAVNVKAPPGGWDLPAHAANARSRTIAAKPIALQSKLN